MGAIGTGARSMDELATQLPMNRKAIAAAAAKLIQRAYVERLETGVYGLTENGRAALHDGAELRSGPHRGQRKYMNHRASLQQRAWNAMRLQSRFTIGDIVTLAATELDRKPEASLQRLFNRMTKTGYLVELPTRVKTDTPRSNGNKQWKLVRDTGPRAPRWLDRQQAFHDWNTKEVFACLR